MARQIWDKFIENSQACFRPGLHLTVDEQLFPSKNRCSFIQYMPNKPDKFGIKTWMLVDVETKYILNGFPYLGKESDRPTDKLQGEFIVEKLIEPYKNKGYCVTADNFFSSYTLVKNLLKKKTTFIGTVRKNKKELPTCVKELNKIYASELYEDGKGCTVTIYQGRKDKNVSVFSSFHEKLFTIHEHERKLPNVIDTYNKTKVGVDCVDNMSRLYSVRTKTRRWPVAVFFNILNLVGINSWILYKACNKSKISRRMYLRSLADELLEMVNQSLPIETLDTPVASRKRLASTDPVSSPKSAKKKCQIRLCNGNKSSFTCDECKQFTCGSCVGEKIFKSICKNCYEQVLRI